MAVKIIAYGLPAILATIGGIGMTTGMPGAGLLVFLGVMCYLAPMLLKLASG